MFKYKNPSTMIYCFIFGRMHLVHVNQAARASFIFCHALQCGKKTVYINTAFKNQFYNTS